MVNLDTEWTPDASANEYQVIVVLYRTKQIQRTEFPIVDRIMVQPKTPGHILDSYSRYQLPKKD